MSHICLNEENCYEVIDMKKYSSGLSAPTPGLYTCITNFDHYVPTSFSL